jgi:hypothetical protein
VKIEINGPRLADANAEDRAAVDAMEGYDHIVVGKVTMGKFCLKDNAILKLGEGVRWGPELRDLSSVLPPFPKMKIRPPPPS